MTILRRYLPLLKLSSIYGGTNILNAAIPFFLLPVLTRHLSTADYGIIAMFQVTIAFITPVIGVSLQGAIGRRYFDRDEIDLGAYIGNAFMLLLANAVLLAAVTTIFDHELSAALGIPVPWLWSILAVAFCQCVISIMLTLFEVQGLPFQYSMLQLAQTIINVSLTLYLVVHLHRQWQGRIEAQVITAVAAAIACGFILARMGMVRFSYNRVYMTNALKFGVPLIPHALGAMLMSQTDRFLITNLVGIEATGLYAVGYQIASVLLLVQQSVNSAYFPWLYGLLKKNEFESKLLVVKLTYGYFGLIICAAAVLVLFSHWLLPYFVGDRFAPAAGFITWLAVSAAFQCMYYMIAIYIAYIEKTQMLAWVTFFTAVCSVSLNYVLIKAHGAIGAAQASAIAYCLGFILTWILSSRVYDMPWNLKRPA